MKKRFLFSLFSILFIQNVINAQENKLEFGKPVKYLAKDSSFSIAVGARIQTMAEVDHFENEEETITDFYIRRLRLNITGHALSPKITYRIQLSFSRRDISADNMLEENNLFLRDAMLFYQPNKNWKFGFGQTKAPGNRQRQVSSANLQFADRSNTNFHFTLDRDRGIWITNQQKLGKKNAIWTNTFALTAGEGRVSNENSTGLSYTWRSEILPFGKFKNEGEYVESDIYHEDDFKMALAGVYSYNHKARRELGQLGEYLFNKQTSNIRYYGADLMMKYRGWSFLGELYFRKASNSISQNPNDASQHLLIYTGTGLLLQSGYLFTPKDEIAVRYGFTDPDKKAAAYIEKMNEYYIAYSHYFYKHHLKLQTDLGWLQNKSENNFQWRLTGIIGF